MPVCVRRYTLLGLPWWLSGKESACNAGDRVPGVIPGLRRSPGGGQGNSAQYSYLENPLQAAVHTVTKSQTQQK